jgi:prepilin-type N-terminal cleavage/methylation domain-containing protein
MRCRPWILRNPKGFTLLEIAIVMVIIGLLTGGGVSMMKILTERKARNETMAYLQQARSALISFAASQGRLPWADGNADGLADSGVARGTLPYLTLQMAPADPYKRVLRYELNTHLAANRSATCAALRSGLTARPLVVDGDGVGTAFNVALVLISAGPMDADNNGSAFDAFASGTHQGNNITGTPNYLRYPPMQTFDDLTAYIGGNELFGQMCEYLSLAVNNTSGNTVYVRDVNRGLDLGRLDDDESAVYSIISGTKIELRTAANGGGSIVSTATPPTPVILAGTGATINVEEAAGGGGGGGGGNNGGNNGGGNGGGIGGGVGGGQNH